MVPQPTLHTSLLPTETATYLKGTQEVSSTATSHNPTSTMTLMSSLKRKSPESPGCQYRATSRTDSDSMTAFKKRQLSPPNLNIPTDIQRSLDLLTPPSSPWPELPARTMRLKLEISRPEITKQEQRRIKRHMSDARHWIPKLQRPFPKNTEIKAAYKYKLMRHYTDPQAPAVSNFIKPRIDRSPRVENLLKRFPLIEALSDTSTPPAVKPGVDKSKEVELLKWAKNKTQKEALQENIKITSSISAQKLAWEAFSSREQDRIDRGREAMMQSGLWSDDLARESVGIANELPEWRKTKTGWFAKSARSGGYAEGQHAAKTSAPRY